MPPRGHATPAARARAATRAKPRTRFARTAAAVARVRNRTAGNRFAPGVTQAVYTGYVAPPVRYMHTAIGLRYKPAKRGELTPAQALAYFDPADKDNQRDPIALPNSLGNFLTLGSSTVGSWTVDSGTNGDVYMVQQTGPCGVAAYWWYSAGADALKVTAFTYGNLLATPPASVRTSRMSIDMANTTQPLKQEGFVQALQISNMLEWNWDTPAPGIKITALFQSEVSSMLSQHPQAKVYSANQMRSGLNLVGVPASIVGVTKWRDYVAFAGLTPAEQETQVSTDASEMSFTTTIVRIAATSVAQTYLIKCNHQWMCRYPANEILAAAQRPGPSTSVEEFGARTEAAQAAQAAASGHVRAVDRG